jgi:hypothetical protein
VQEHGVAIGLFGGEEAKNKSEGIEEGGFKMSKVGHAAEDVRIPVRDLMVKAQLVVEELLHGQIELLEVDADQSVALEDVPEKITAEG